MNELTLKLNKTIFFQSTSLKNDEISVTKVMWIVEEV